MWVTQKEFHPPAIVLLWMQTWKPEAVTDEQNTYGGTLCFSLPEKKLVAVKKLNKPWR